MRGGYMHPRLRIVTRQITPWGLQRANSLYKVISIGLHQEYLYLSLSKVTSQITPWCL